MRETNDQVRLLAEARRYPVKRLEDGEVVILARRHRKRRGWWALETQSGERWWAFYLEVDRPGRLLRGLPVIPGMVDRSSDAEVYFRVPVLAGETLMASGPAWCRVTPRRSLSAEHAAAGAARLQKARTPA